MSVHKRVECCCGWKWPTLLVIWSGFWAPLLLADEPSGLRVDFLRQIRPIMADRCFRCHGPDAGERQADLRLDTDDTLFDERRDGGSVIARGNADESLLFQRISATSDDERMPPPDIGPALSSFEQDLIYRWIEQGAEFASHWSFDPPCASAFPDVRNRVWPRNGIDYFVLAELEKRGLAPTPEADRATMIRRVTLDLTGLPPAPADVDAFLADSSHDAWERLVDRLLASPRYGERMAVEWLDAARYADTSGYQLDTERSMWPWRDWVIRAFNRNLSFDRFTIEQLAGDLLPNAMLDQRIATGFNRNHRINSEGGSIPEEFLVENIVDRVDTTATVWLGLTMTCARCHDHKYDPVTQREFYEFYAFFHNVPEKGTGARYGNSDPVITFPTADQRARQQELARQLAVVEQEVAEQEESTAGFVAAREKMAVLRKRAEKLAADIPSTMVMQELDSPRETFLLVRGLYDRPAERVSAGVPRCLPPMDPDLPRNRLGLAQWLVNPRNPLTARVTVNRYWQMYFGTGLVRTSEDFGSQGDLPSHKRLLDWLASRFVRQSWDVKVMQKLIVSSATYRQQSRSSPRHLELDPENRLLGRAPRFRLPAESIRDQALFLGGLLVESLGGPSVRPYQPAGLWAELTAKPETESDDVYVQGSGADLYRRSLYTFWKRSIPPPGMEVFDAPSRETCTVRRSQTSTSLQALTLLNDVTYVEAARGLAQRVLTESGHSEVERIRFAIGAATARLPDRRNEMLLLGALQRYRSRFRGDPMAAKALLLVGESPRDESIDVVDHAAWTLLASVILNLDATVMKD